MSYTAQSSLGAKECEPSIIGADLVVIGPLASTGDLQINGRVQGEVRVANLAVGGSGHVVGDVYADRVTILGHVEGNIFARRVSLGPAAWVKGDLLLEAFSAEFGAYFDGACVRSNDPNHHDATVTASQQEAARATVSRPSAVRAA